jgi:hypothetical protein
VGIPESQLETWAKQGSVAQSSDTYQAIKNTLDHADAPYHDKSYSTFLQGSYGNDTNVYKESDVDIVIRLEQVYYSDTSLLTPPAKQNYDNAFVAATYGWKDFKPEVLAWLQKKYSGVNEGKKAITIAPGGGRREADVIVSANFRRYRKNSNGTDGEYDLGMCFWTTNNSQIENFPKQHGDNCTTKHKDTTQWFKPAVRIFKNMRNRMIEDLYLEEGVATSYFIEGLVWNAPNTLFGTTYAQTVGNILHWAEGANRDELVCASHLHWLVRDNTYKSWPTANFDTYLTQVRTFWDDW